EEQPNEEHPTEETTEEHPAEQTTEEHPADQTTEEVVTSEHPDENQTSTVETQVEDTSVTEISEPETEVNNFNVNETSQENNTEDENEAYKLVLAAMQSSPDSPEQTSLINVSPLFASSETPSVETTEGETTETPVAAPSSSEVSPKLNNAVQQLLSLSDEFASKFMAYGGSDGKTINEVIDDFAVDLFTDEELKVDGVPAEWNVQGAVPAKVDAEIEVIEKEVKDLEQVAESSVINTSIKEQQQTVTEAEPTQTEETTAEVEPIQAEETTTEVEPTQTEETTAEVEPIQAEETTTEVEPIQAEETTHEVEPTQTEETTHEVEPTQTEETTHEVEPTQTEENTHEVEPTQTEETTTVNSTPVQEVSNEEQSTEQQSGIEQEETVASTEEQQGEHEPTEVEETVASTEEQQGEHEPTEVEETFASEKPTVTEEIAPIENEPAVLVLPQTPVEEQNNVVDASLPEENKVVEESAAAQEENSNTVEEPFGDDEHPVEFEAPAEQPVASEGEETAPVNEQILDEHIAPIESQITATEHAPAEDETLTELLTTDNPENETEPEHTSDDNEPAVSETGLRMLTILKLYKEHVNYRDSEHIVDHRHYGHLRNFQRHLSCLTDNSCDFSKHLHLMEREHQERITQQSRHLEATQTTEERGFFGKVWCGIRKFFRRPCPEAEKVAVQATVASPSHLQAATESRGWFGRAWCSVRKFFRRPCPESEVQPVVVQTTTTSTTTQAHLFADEEETGFFTFMTSRKLAHYLNNAEKHLIAHKQEDDGSHSETEESAVNTDEEITEEHPVESEETQTENVQAGEDNQETVVAEEETAESEPVQEPTITVGSSEEPVEEPTITVGSSEKPTEESALANNTDAFRDAIKQLIQQLPECISNEDIKEVSHNFIDKAHEWLTQNDQAFPQTSKNIAHTVDIVKFASELGSNITPVQLKAVIDSIHTSVVDKIKQNFNSDSLAQEASQLESLRDHFDQLKNALRSYLPVDSVLEKDLEELVDKLDNQVKVHYEAKDASEEDIAAAREYLIKSFDAEFNGIDTNTASEKVKSIMTSLKSIVNGNFGKSLNEENLNFIVHRVVQAFHADLERTKDASKASDFVIDTDDLDLLVDNIIDELKKSREDNQKAIIDLRDFHRWVQAENKKLDFNVDTGNKALDAAESLIKYENAVYDTLGSAEFSEQLKNYVSKYYNVLKAHTKPWSPLVVYSQAYKALTKDITEVNPFPQESTVVNRRALHMMRSAIGSQIRHMDKLSQEDRKFFQFFNSLLAEWAQSKDENAFARKLDQIIRSLQGRQTGLRNLTLVKADPSHKLLDKITQFKDSLTNIVGNLGTTYDNAIKLSDTIGEGKTLAQQAKDFFTLKNPILSGNTQQTSGFFGKVKSWFGGRRLEKHFGVTETFESLKNLYNDLDTAHKTAEELKKNVETAKSFANGVKDVFNAVGGIVA
ncbi:MAG: hypothetical protein IM572_05835, partial [Chitinophagaceae bacterium]|nr:hypothetical protein [Chitinophagaceae bacterium]